MREWTSTQAFLLLCSKYTIDSKKLTFVPEEPTCMMVSNTGPEYD